MPELNSRAIKRVEYDAQTRRMTIWFPRGNSYDFCGVPPAIYQGLITANSAGAYYNAHVRDLYPC